MSLAHQNEIVALGREPINADSPVGDPCRYDPLFEELQAQIDRIGSLTGEEVAWPRVVELATEILKQRSKDLLVVTYLTLGLFEQHGYAGLAAALEAYHEFLRAFWEKCYPKVKPPQGRYNAVQYLADRLLPQIELKDGRCRRLPAAGEREAVHQATERVDQLVELVDQCFKTQPESPNLAPLKRALHALCDKVGPLTPTAAPAAPADQRPAAATAPPAPDRAAPAAPAPAATLPTSFVTAAQAAESAIQVARYLLTQNQQDPRPYLLLRAVHFGGLSELPRDGFLPPPAPPHRRQYLDNLLAGGNWGDLLSEAEGQFAATPLWLDLQRHVACALRGLGPAFQPVFVAVVVETLGLRARLPGLFDLTFKDRTPFADGTTKAWLDQVAGELGLAGSGGGPLEKGDALAEALAEARQLMSEAKHPEAVARLSTAVETSNGRQRFRAQLALARMLADMNRPALAVSLLEDLDAQINHRGLDEWEPALACEVLCSLYDGLVKSLPKPTAEDSVRMSQVFGRLCRVNPGAALKLDGSRAKT